MVMTLREASADACGGKAAALAVLLREGLPVPDGFVVPFAAHRGARSDAGMSVPHELRDALASHLARMGDPPVAVRSSAASEDTAARTRAEAARAEIIAPLIEQADSDAATLLAARDRARDADAARRAVGRLRRRRAEHTRLTAEQDRAVVEAAVRDRWGSTPTAPEHVPAWSEAGAARQATPTRGQSKRGRKPSASSVRRAA